MNATGQELKDSTFNLHLRQELPSPKINAKSFLLPAALVSYGFVALESHSLQTLNNSTRDELKHDQTNFSSRLDDYLQYSPAMAVYILNASGVKGKYNFRDRTILYITATLLSTATVCILKNNTILPRPDLSANNTFPSGHTTTAFLSAEFLKQEYKSHSPLYGLAGYGVATVTGAMRMYNHKHYLSDVVAGAGIGLLSTKISYLVYPYLKRKFSHHRNSYIRGPLL